MHGVMLEMSGVAVGVIAYALGRGVLAVRHNRHSHTRSQHAQRLDGLLAPYEQLTPCPIPVRSNRPVDADGELPPNVHRLRPR